ncbi:MAG: hypothetical protein KBE65_03875 [Phycisphaerae bacterium]|nr:hypothetical protein [Phycisphaerae bacterium]
MDWRSAICCLAMACLLSCSGCETSPKPPAVASRQTAEPVSPGADQSLPTVPTGFGPARVDILPLSEIRGAAGIGQDAELTVYLVLLDAFGCSIKSPCTLRFEVYEYVRRSAQPKGQRLAIWPDFDLTQPAANHGFWRPLLRAYEFQLGLRANRNQTYILEATCLGPDGKRLSGECAIRAGQ